MSGRGLFFRVGVTPGSRSRKNTRFGVTDLWIPVLHTVPVLVTNDSSTAGPESRLALGVTTVTNDSSTAEPERRLVLG